MRFRDHLVYSSLFLSKDPSRHITTKSKSDHRKTDKAENGHPICLRNRHRGHRCSHSELRALLPDAERSATVLKIFQIAP